MCCLVMRVAHITTDDKQFRCRPVFRKVLLSLACGWAVMQKCDLNDVTKRFCEFFSSRRGCAGCVQILFADTPLQNNLHKGPPICAHVTRAQLNSSRQLYQRVAGHSAMHAFHCVSSLINPERDVHKLVLGPFAAGSISVFAAQLPLMPADFPARGHERS